MTGKPSVFGGGRRVFLQIMQRLPKNVFNVFSWCPLDAKQEKQLILEGVNIIKVPFSDNNPILYMLHLSRFIRTNNVHIVHSQGPRADVYSRIASRFTNRPIVINTCAMLVDGYDVMFPKKLFYMLCDRVTERYVDKFIVVSESLVGNLEKQHGIEVDRIVKLHNGIELDEYLPNHEAREKIRNTFLLEEGELLVGTIGRLVYQKGFEFFLRAVPKILESFPRTKIVLVGDGPLKLELESLAKNLGITQSCMFVGFRDDIPEVLSSFDVFVLPSIVEGHPIAILEAMAMARAIVASDIDGVREQVENGRTGILIPPGDPQALAEGITQLLRDKFQAQRFGMEARKQVEEMFDIRRQVALHGEVYKELIKGRRNEA